MLNETVETSHLADKRREGREEGKEVLGREYLFYCDLNRLTCTILKYTGYNLQRAHRGALCYAAKKYSVFSTKKYILKIWEWKKNPKQTNKKQPQKYRAREKASSYPIMQQLDFQILPMMIGLRVK